jgi:catechol 2,3-dioxygenase-like lactoylglutathione lyase family enzyme
MRIWYRVSNLETTLAFYRDVLGFTETFLDANERWATLERGVTEIAIGEGRVEADADAEGQVATIDVTDVKAERDRLEQAGAEVGTVLELHGTMRLLDVFDPDGNRIQLAEDLA